MEVSDPNNYYIYLVFELFNIKNMCLDQHVGIESRVFDPWQLLLVLVLFLDKSWINLSSISDDYERGVEEFIEFT